jgi:hypothetical protein
MTLTDMPTTTGSRQRRAEWSADGADSSAFAPQENRAVAASADRVLRNSALAANSGRLLARLETERTGDARGYVPENGPSGERPEMVVPAAASREPAPLAEPPQTLAEVIAVEVPDDLSRLTALQQAALHAVEVELDLTGDEPTIVGEPDRADTHLFDRAPTDDAVMGMRVQASEIVELSIPDILRELALLHGEGILTDKEFTTKKAELLARI